MTGKVRVDRNQLNYFRKLARENAPLEIQAYLIGEVISPSLTVIESFAYPKQYHTQTETEVAWLVEEHQAVERSAEERGKRIVGEIHSHPEWDAVMSKDDYRSHIEEGRRICGICSIMGRKTRVRFWVAESALPVTLEYEKTQEKTS